MNKAEEQYEEYIGSKLPENSIINLFMKIGIKDEIIKALLDFGESAFKAGQESDVDAFGDGREERYYKYEEFKDWLNEK